MGCAHTVQETKLGGWNGVCLSSDMDPSAAEELDIVKSFPADAGGCGMVHKLLKEGREEEAKLVPKRPEAERVETNFMTLGSSDAIGTLRRLKKSKARKWVPP